MSSITNGLFGGGKGLDFEAKSADLINNGIGNTQSLEQYNQAQGALQQQQALANQLAGANGIQNQSDVYNQLQQMAAGQGPNPAQAQLANATGANTANQAALMAGQRGASSNPALIARQAAMQGSANQQNAIGQGAALQAQQSQNAINAAGQLAGQQVGNQMAGQSAYTQAAQNSQQNALNAINQQNQARLGNTSQQNNANVSIAQEAAKQQGEIFGNVMGAGAKALMMADGGQIGPQSHVGQYFHKMANGGKVPALLSPGEKYLDPKAVEQVKQGANPMQVGQTVPGKPVVGGAKNSYANDNVKATLEEGGVVVPRSVTKSKDADDKARAFVEAVLSRKGKGLPKK